METSVPFRVLLALESESPPIDPPQPKMLQSNTISRGEIPAYLEFGRSKGTDGSCASLSDSDPNSILNSW